MSFFKRIFIGISLVFLTLALLGPSGHPYFNSAALWEAFLISFLFVLWSLSDSFFLSMMAVFFSAFFLQRIAVLYFWPEQADYASYLPPNMANMEITIRFGLLSIVAISLGYVIARRKGGTVHAPMTAEETVSMPWGKVNFQKLFQVYTYIAIPCALMQLYLLFAEHVGLGSFQFAGYLATPLRLARFPQSLSIISFFPFLVPGMSRRTKRLAFIQIAMQVLLGLGATSKGMFLAMFLQLIVCLHFAGRKIRAKYFGYGFLIAVFGVLFFMPFIQNIRSLLLSGSSWEEAWAIVSKATDVSAFDKIMLFSLRLNGLDVLRGFFAVGRDVFPSYVSLLGDLRLILQSFVPKEIWPKPDWIPMSYLIPHLMRGFNFPVVDWTGFTGENMGLLGIAYIYFGFSGGLIFLFLWAALSIRILSSKIHRIYKLLYIYNFAFIFMDGSGFITPIVQFYESMIMLFVSYQACCWLGHEEIPPRRMHPQILMASTVIHDVA